MKKLILFLFVLIINFFLLTNNYAQYPQRGATSDEYAFAFLGVSLLITNKPISWSFFPAYKQKKDLIINKLYFPIVEPYLDHPPLYGLLVGGWAILRGEDTFAKVQLKTIRLIPIALSLVSSVFLFLLGKRLYGYKIGLWAMLIFSTTTIFIINSRMVVAESLLTVIFLAILNLLSSWKTVKVKQAIMLGILCGSAVLTKVVGIAALVFTLFLLITQGAKPRIVLLVSGLSLLFAGSFIVYGTFFDKELFWEIQKTQAGRNIGPEVLWALLTDPIVVNKVFHDGWYLFGWFSLFFCFADYKKHKAILIPSLIYLLILLASLTQAQAHGWYILPLFPFMAIASAHVISEGLARQRWLMFILLLFVGISQIKFLYQDLFGLTATQFRVLLGMLFGPFLIFELFQKQKPFMLLGQIVFYLFILGNIVITFTYIHPA